MSLPALDTSTDANYEELLVVEKKEVNPSAQYSDFGLGCAATGKGCTRTSEATVTGLDIINVIIPRFPTCTACKEHGINNQ